VREYFFLRTKLGRRFLAGFLIVALLTPVVGGWLAIRKAESAIRRQTFVVLRTASDGVEAELREFVHHFKSQLLHLSQHEKIRNQLELANASPTTSDNIPSFRDLLLSQHEKIPDVEEIFVLTLKGRVIASSTGENVGRDYSSVDFFVHGKESLFEGDVFRDDRTGQPTWVMTCPIKDASMNRVLGIMAIRIDPRDLNSLMSGKRVLALGADSQPFRIGDTGESYIVNRDHVMITDSRYFPGSILKRKVETLPVRVASERGQEITTEYEDYRGYKVSGASFILRNFNWVVLTEIDFTQAFAPIKGLRREIITWMIFLVFLAAVCASIYTSRLLKPIRLLGESDNAFARRDEAAAVVSEAGLPDDELGELVRQRNARVKAVFDYQRQIEARSAKLQEMINEIEHISYAIVHDMRAPLRAMQGFAEILRAEWTELTGDERNTYLRRISIAAASLDDLIRDVLTYNKTVLDRAPLHPVDLGSVLGRILTVYPNLQADRADIFIEGVLPVVIGNETLLTQCFSNLLDNAVKFVAPGVRPRVRIWAETSKEAVGKFARIWIEDNGVGLPQDSQSRIFRLFQRSTHDKTGTGIGLAIVHKVVEHMGGRVGFQSAPGKGTRFWVELPIAPVETK
jgi:signal transduction histidine kinase